MPELRTSDRTRLRRHGALPGDDFLESRTITATGYVTTSDRDTAPEIAALIDGTITSDEDVLVMKWHGVGGNGLVRVNARVRRRHIPQAWPRWQRGEPQWAIQWEATDPRLYANTASSGSVGLAADTTGLTWALTWPLNWGGVSESNLLNCVNAGNFPTPVTLTITGPCTNPSVENVTQGRTLALTMTVATGETVVIDTDARTVLLNGTASRYSKLTTAEWFDLDPGTDQLRFTASTATAATMQADWRSAYI